MDPQITQPTPEPALPKSHMRNIFMARGIAAVIILLVVLIAILIAMWQASQTNSPDSSTSSSSSIDTSSATATMADCNDVEYSHPTAPEVTYTYNDCVWSEPEVTETATAGDAPDVSIEHEYIATGGSAALTINLSAFTLGGFVGDCYQVSEDWRVVYTHSDTGASAVEVDKTASRDYYLSVYTPDADNFDDFADFGSSEADFCGGSETVVNTTIDNPSYEDDTAPDGSIEHYFYIVTANMSAITGDIGNAADSIITGIVD